MIFLLMWSISMTLGITLKNPAFFGLAAGLAIMNLVNRLEEK